MKEQNNPHTQPEPFREPPPRRVRGAAVRSQYSARNCERICEMLGQGMPLTRVCAALGLKRTTVLDWVRRRPAFAEAYAAARLQGYEALADEIIELSDEAAVLCAGDGSAAAAGATIQAKRLQVESRKWLLSNMMPRVYGERKDASPGAAAVQSFEAAAREALNKITTPVVPDDLMEEGAG